MKTEWCQIMLTAGLLIGCQDMPSVQNQNGGSPSNKQTGAAAKNYQVAYTDGLGKCNEYGFDSQEDADSYYQSVSGRYDVVWASKRENCPNTFTNSRGIKLKYAQCGCEDLQRKTHRKFYTTLDDDIDDYCNSLKNQCQLVSDTYFHE